MGVKYTIPFRCIDNRLWRGDIEVPGYDVTPIALRGVQGSVLELAYDPTQTDDPFSEMIKSTLTLNVYNSGVLDISELQQTQRKNLKVNIYRENSVYWVGYLNPAGLQRDLKATTYPLQLIATDGLDMLDVPYVHNNLPGLTTTPTRCIMNYIRQILFADSNLGLPLPIRWSNKLKCTAFPDEANVFTGSVSWSNNGEGFASFQDNAPNKTCSYILSGILKSMQCRIYQAKGKWVIRRIPEIVSGTANYNEIPATLGTMIVQTGSESLLNQIGRSGYPFINENQVMTSIAGLKSCKVTYNANIKENILPNGNQDLTSLSLPLYWGTYSADLNYESVTSLNKRDGSATQIANSASIINVNYFTHISPGSTLYTGGLPINTYSLVKKMSFGFTFFPQLGFPTDENGYIIWELRMFIKVVLNLGGTQYFLNEFGFWTETDTPIPISVDGMKLGDIATINFDKFQGIILPTIGSNPIAGDVSDIKVLFSVNPGQEYTVDDIYIQIENGDDVFESILEDSKNTNTDERELEISSSFNGYMVSNFMNNWGLSDSECYFSDALVYTGTLTGLTANAIMRYRYKSSDVYNGDMNVRNANWSFDEIYLIDSQAMTKFLPVKANYNIEKCECNIVAIECRNDNIALIEKYYSSNDEQLSN